MRGENGIRVKINERRERRERDKSEIYEVAENKVRNIRTVREMKNRMRLDSETEAKSYKNGKQ